MPRRDRPDYLLFAVFFFLLFVPLSFVDLTGGENTVAGCAGRIAKGSVNRWEIGGLIYMAAIMAVPSAGFGWWAQGVAVRRGWSLRWRPRTEQADDYDDRPPPEAPPGAS